MNTTESRLRTIKLIDAMKRYPSFSEEIGLTNTSHYTQKQLSSTNKKSKIEEEKK